MKRSILTTTVVTIYLVIYQVASSFNVPAAIIFSMFLLSPFMMIWMVVNILKDTSTEVIELKEGEEWGYQDRNRQSFN